MDGDTVASRAVAWSSDELQSIARTDDLHISPFREDGETYGTPTWIWSVVVDGDLYVRGYNGQQSRWYQAALAQKAGRIRAAGMTKTTVVNPGFFRTELLTEQSTNFAEPSIADYDERRGPLIEYWKSQNGKQSGDPAKLARALITIASQEPPARRFIAGADAIATTEQKIADLKTQIDANRALSTSRF